MFFALVGASNFVQSVVRFRLAKFSRRVLTDIFSGTALLVFAYLIALWSSHVITFLSVLVIEVAICGALLIAYGVILFVFFKEH